MSSLDTSALPLPAAVTDALQQGQRLRALRELATLRAISLGAAEQLLDQLMRVDIDLRESYLASIGLTQLLRVSFQDGLAFPSGQVALASYRCVVYCRTPADWLTAGQLEPATLELLFEMLYGEHWRAGNSDGSAYVVSQVCCEVLDLAQRAALPWLSAADDATQRHWFARAMADGGFAKVERVMF